LPNLAASGHSLRALLKELRHNASPSRLVARAHAGAVVTMEVLVEEDQVLPVRVFLIQSVRPMNRTPAVGSPQENLLRPPREFGGAFPQRHPLPGTGRALYLEFVAQIVVELLQRFDEQKVHREPYRSAPVRIAAE